FADTAAQRSRPYRSIAASIHGINTVLSESIGLRISPACHGPVSKLQMCEPNALAPDPHAIRVAADGIDDVIGWDPGCNRLDTTILEGVQPTLSWSEPCATLPVNVNGSTVLETKIHGGRIGNEGTVPNAAQSLGTSDPEIAFAILK